MGKYDNKKCFFAKARRVANELVVEKTSLAWRLYVYQRNIQANMQFNKIRLFFRQSFQRDISPTGTHALRKNHVQYM